MAGELVSFGIQKLWDLLSQECEQFQGVNDQVTELKHALNLLSSFLKDADAKKHTSAVVKNCVEEIKDIVYEAEDVIETYLLKEELGITSGIKKRIRRLACIIPDRMKIASDMRGISERISQVICDMKDFGVQQIIIADGMDSQPLQERQREMRQEFAGKYESELVGLEANVKKLVEYLVEEDDVQVVSITGMGGLGKTTLARQAFNHDMVKNKFDGFAWVCVSQVFNRKNVWQTILQKLTPKEKKDEILHMTEATLQEELFRLLNTLQKSLIVFDDIWEEEHWDLINLIFPEKGWKVLLTSRKEIVTTRRNTINFKPECLTTEDSWTLFQMIALPRKGASEEKIDEEMEVMGKQMIKHCGGLPLAIRVLGGLLDAKYTVHDWKRVSENIGSRILEGTNLNDNNIGSVNRVLSTSFEELPSILKNCFLYLAHFPEDYQISVKKLSYYWAAEGILRYHEGETIRDVGDVYIEELVRRNMVISERDVKTLRFEGCHLHDMMREICLSKAKEENFLQIVGICSQAAHSQTCSTSRRFVSQNPTTLHVERDINNSKVRSLVVISKDDKWELSSLSFARLQLLKVLDFSKAQFEGGELPYGIGKLIHLRYLSLHNAKVSHLPSSLKYLKLLIYLNLGVYWHHLFVPNVLMGMKELRYLELPERMHEKTKLELSNLEKLETLKNFSTKSSSLEDLRRMSKLRILKIELTKEASIESLSASIGGLRHLEDLYIVGDDEFDRKIEMGFIVNFVHLKQLSLSIYMPSLPKPLPSHLTTITLQGCRLEEDPMPILDKLPQLKEVTLWHNTFCGRRMVCSSGGFPQLQKLSFHNLEELEEWIVEEGSMPLLHTLEIYDCKKLKELPDGLRLRFITKKSELLSYGRKMEGETVERRRRLLQSPTHPFCYFWI